jgi:hypothetical protein
VFWLAVTLALYWRVLRGGVIAWRIACVTAAIGAAIFSIVVVGSWVDRTSDTRFVLLALLDLLSVAMLTSATVRDDMSRAPVHSPTGGAGP